MPKDRHKITAAVHLILEEKGEILLLRRFNTGYEDGNYSVVAGHIDSNERAHHAMIREAKEEAGITIKKEHLETIHVMHRKGKDRERIDFFVKAKSWHGKPINMEKHKCDDLSWFGLDELPENIVPYIMFALENIKNRNYYSEFGW
jgi:8-oxo-dGTP diphosphatase